MSLTKIPFILLATWGINMSYRSPNPPPPQLERFTSSVPLESWGFVKWAPIPIRVIQFIFCAAEISTILASVNPSSPLSKLILSLVWDGGKPENLHISNAAAIGWVLITLGTWIRLVSYRYLGQFFRFEASIQKDHELIVSGPYSIVRHPSYTAFIFIFGGSIPWHLSKGSWFMESGSWNTILGKLLVVTYFSVHILIIHFALTRMLKEDIALRDQFGKKWDDWAKRVPYTIFPGIY